MSTSQPTPADATPTDAATGDVTTPRPVQEFVDSRGRDLRTDPLAGVLRGVKLLGLTSRNGRRYLEGALRRAIGLYEGAKVNVNHPQRDPLGPRDYRDRLGVVRNVRLEPGAGLFGDLHYNPKHALSEQLAWDAEHAPENVGLSHNVLARTRREGDELQIEEITRVQSVDLVADPATTSGLYEHNDPVSTADRVESTAEQTAPTVEQQPLQDEADRLRGELRAARRELLIERRLFEHGLAPSSDSVAGPFLESLRDAAEDARVESLIEDRARLLKAAEFSGRERRPPESREQRLTHKEDPHGGAEGDTASFVAALRRAA